MLIMIRNIPTKKHADHHLIRAIYNGWNGTIIPTGGSVIPKVKLNSTGAGGDGGRKNF